MNDLIERAAAIDAIEKIEDEVIEGSGFQYEKWKQFFMNLSSAQPEIIHCKDYKWKNRYNCTRAVEVLIDDDKYCAWAERREDEC